MSSWGSKDPGLQYLAEEVHPLSGDRKPASIGVRLCLSWSWHVCITASGMHENCGAGVRLAPRERSSSPLAGREGAG